MIFGLLLLFVVICAIIKIILVILVSRPIMRSLTKLLPFDHTAFFTSGCQEYIEIKHWKKERKETDISMVKFFFYV